MSNLGTGLIGQSKKFTYFFFGMLLILAAGIRLYDLTDLPLYFHPTRQLRSAIISRGMYYQHAEGIPDWKRDFAISQWKQEALIEPPVFESIVAATYRFVGSEHLWIPRVFSIFFWILGAFPVFYIAKSMSTADGGIISMLHYLFVPLAIYGSRSFQPDPLMVMLILFAMWGIFRWVHQRSWRNTLFAGIFAGLAIFVKTVAVFPILGIFIGGFLGEKKIKTFLMDIKTWTAVSLTVLPAVGFYLYGIFLSGELVQQFSLRFFPALLSDPAFYIRWYEQIKTIVGFGSFFLSLVGILLLTNHRHRWMAIGLFAGYVLYGLSFPYHILTHNYYHLPLIPLVAILLAPAGSVILERLGTYDHQHVLQVCFLGIVLSALAFKLWDVRVNLARDNYRGEAKYWQELGQKFKPDDKIIGLSHDYGYRLSYFGWRGMTQLMTEADITLREYAGQDISPLPDEFSQIANQYDYFLITLVAELDRQPALSDVLFNTYQVKDQGDGYFIFDLKHPVEKQNP